METVTHEILKKSKIRLALGLFFLYNLIGSYHYGHGCEVGGCRYTRQRCLVNSGNSYGASL